MPAVVPPLTSYSTFCSLQGKCKGLNQHHHIPTAEESCQAGSISHNNEAQGLFFFLICVKPNCKRLIAFGKSCPFAVFESLNSETNFSFCFMQLSIIITIDREKKIGLKFLQSQFSDNYFTTFTQPLIAFPFIFLCFLCAHSTSLHCFSFKSLESSKCHTCFLFPFQQLITCPFQPSKISQLFQQICEVWLTVVFQSVVLIFIKIIGSNKYTNFTKDVKILKLVKKF